MRARVCAPVGCKRITAGLLCSRSSAKTASFSSSGSMYSTQKSPESLRFIEPPAWSSNLTTEAQHALPAPALQQQLFATPRQRIRRGIHTALCRLLRARIPCHLSILFDFFYIDFLVHVVPRRQRRSAGVDERAQHHEQPAEVAGQGQHFMQVPGSHERPQHRLKNVDKRDRYGRDKTLHGGCYERWNEGAGPGHVQHYPDVSGQ